MRCTKCSDIHIQRLIELAQVEFEGCSVPVSSYYQHYESFQDLEASAESGCDMCRLIVRAFSDATASLDYYEEEQSLLAAIKGWEDAALIHIAIEASHVYSGASLSEVQNFDLLQICARTAKDLLEASDDPWSTWALDHSVHLMLSTGRDRPLKLGDFTVGLFETDTDLGSDENFAIAKGWIDTCTVEHKECPSKDEPPLPTRVIDVGNGHEDCRMLITASNSKAHYVALSHCWGGYIDCVLKAEKLQEFQQRLPWNRLAANFQDAVTVTRKLGVRYLWVDSFCIVQDDDQDWAHESSKMADIYRNAVITIAAMSSPASGHGFIRNLADPPNLLDQLVKIPLSNNDQRAVAASRFRQPDNHKRESFNTLSLQAPLSQRGWCLQEAVLAPRVLFYGQDRIYWKCLQGYQSSDGACPGRLFSATDLYPALLPVLFAGVGQQAPPPNPACDAAAVLRDYYVLVNSFTQRKLSEYFDKLPAFSGLAKPIHLALGGQYLAGLFSTYIRSGLLWKREMDWDKNPAQYRYRAPSWSWVEADDSVLFDYYGIEFLDDTSTFELLDTHIELQRDSVPYGKVTSGYLLVSGLIIEIWRTRETISEDLEWSMELGSAWWDEPMVRGENMRDSTIASYIVELMEDGDGGRHRLAEMVDAEGLRRQRAYEPQFEESVYAPSEKYTALLLHDGAMTAYDSGERTACLILKQVGREDVNIYRRVGLLDLTPHLLEISPQNWTRERLKII